VGRLPSLPGGLHTEPCPPILQMQCERLSATGTPSCEVRPLDDADTAAMLDLTGRVFPGYFRRRTMAMGQYVGVFDDSRLVAMGGERFFADRYREVSGICTDPLYAGRGYAGAIVRSLVASMFTRGLSPILHLSRPTAALTGCISCWASSIAQSWKSSRSPAHPSFVPIRRRGGGVSCDDRCPSLPR